jgi:glycosyltransferase involved in cell wall biosynthesis
MDGHYTKLTESDNRALKSIALIGTHLPRQCGIATFTSHLYESIRQEAPDLDCWVVAMNDRPDGYNYPPQVRLEAYQDKLSDYHLVADQINRNQTDLVCVQHEYGIFGGTRGEFIIELLKNLKVPVVTTLHTILKNPSDQERQIIKQLARHSDQLIVMSKRSQAYLHDIYAIESEKITLIPHGIPNALHRDGEFYKAQLGLKNKKVLLTFGLMSPGKGIETVISALPSIVKEHPEVIYMVVGATHPHIKEQQGEAYRTKLHLLVKKLGVTDHVIFHDQFVSDDVLQKYIGAADISITPYLNEEQAISGPLSYSLGMGKAVVSTPFWHARELLLEGRGRFFPFGDAAQLAQQVTDLLDDSSALKNLQNKAFQFGRQMTWQQVGKRYLKAFESASRNRQREYAA